MAPIFTFGLGSFSSLGKMLLLGALVGSVVCAVHAAAPPPNPTTLGPSVFTAGPLSDFTTLFREWYNNPTATSAQPQPKVTDPVSGKVYPFSLTDPNHVPEVDTDDPIILPPPASHALLAQVVVNQVSNIISAPATDAAFGANTNCAKCIAGLEIGKMVALTVPSLVPTIMLQLCETFKFSSTCNETFSASTDGAVITQVLAYANVSGLDGQMLCNNFVSGSCPLPPVSPLDLTGWFKTPKPANAIAPVPKGTNKLKVLHLSDVHLDPRYVTGSESNCTSGLCCRHIAFNSLSPQKPLAPAPRYGAYHCDTPYDLVFSSLESIPVVTGTEKSGFDFTIYTGDLVSHDAAGELSQEYVEYTESVMYDLFKRTLNAGPVYATIGNHDSNPNAQDAPNTLSPDSLKNQFSWNYDHLSALWEHEGWISSSVASQAKTHYGGYSVSRPDGLRIITFNSDFCTYKANYFAYINMTTSDPGGIMRFLTDELQEAEEMGQRAWIFAHVLSGWDGSNALGNPTNLFYQIVERYSPHVIAAIFFGHSHEDQFEVFYANNATDISADTALATAWICPSVTPGTNLNTAFRMYEVDSETFDILDAYTWYTDVSTFPSLDSQTKHGPIYQYEYSSRDVYGTNITWPANAPLNATWWHRVTEQMEANPGLVQTFTDLTGRQSPLSPPCNTSDCVAAKICYMRSGSVAISKSNCKTSAFGSVQ